MNSKELFPLADAPQAVLVKELKNRGLKIASAESLTGGMVSEYITKVSGASEVFECGICSYSNRIKHEILGVSEETLENYTEYSYQTACEMAQGVRRLSGADIGISTTGIAGPSGGTEEKPVGTVYIRNDTLIVGDADDRDARDGFSLLVRHRTGNRKRGLLCPHRYGRQGQDENKEEMLKTPHDTLHLVDKVGKIIEKKKKRRF